ncbi:type III secretion system inner rod subunit SctI, partial [Escherichia coli]|nr:EscI/YscI/HrpB family type III secretion system inner rod protein [Escherichia coli]EHD5889278.1 EscI/YscI/HrpB family type III secretion system inner rod protein [Escherichia coli]EIG4601484.1 type III secretion system inner rod subunit SctI [Escherichia coli]EIG5981091.1 type III secretion system inner rod subunit SctI [Escherichia coli]
LASLLSTSVTKLVSMQ